MNFQHFADFVDYGLIVFDLVVADRHDHRDDRKANEDTCDFSRQQKEKKEGYFLEQSVAKASLL